MIKTISKFAGSTLLATLLLSGCGSATDDKIGQASASNGSNPKTDTPSNTPSNDNVVSTYASAQERANYEETAAVLSQYVAIAAESSVNAASARQTNYVGETAVDATKNAIDAFKAKLLALKVRIANYKDKVNSYLPDSFQVPDINVSISTQTVIDAATKLHDNGTLSDEQYDKFIARTDLAKVYVTAFFDAIAKIKELKASFTGTEDNTTIDSNSTVVTDANRTANGLLSTVLGTDPANDPINLVGSAVSDTIVSAVNVDAVNNVAGDAFALVLQSDGLTAAMLDLAIGSETIAQIMIDVLRDNWDLTAQMVPMITNPDDTEFAEKFTYLAGMYDNMVANFVFKYIDTTMYDAITKAMTVPSTTGSMENTNLVPSYTGNHKVTSNMGKLMADIGVNYFVKPDATHTIVRSDLPDLYAGDDAFARLMLDVNNGTINERLFYALFSESKMTADFVTTMQQVKANDDATATFFMDNIFLGAELSDLNNTTDVQKDQAMRNITTVATAMFDGYKAEGLAAYSGSFVGFAGLVPFDRFKPYAQAFAAAGYQYIKVNGLDIPGGSIGAWIADKFFPSEEVVAEAENNATAQASARTTNSVLTDTLEWIKTQFASYTVWLGEAKDYLLTNSVGQTIAGAFDEFIGSVKTGIDATIKDLIAKGHDIAEAKIQVLIADQNYRLPAFSDINLSVAYMTSVVKTTAAGILDDPTMIRQFTENARVQGVYDYVNEKLATNKFLAYIPTWMTKLDWIELPANVDGLPKMKLSFSTGSADIYILSDNADAVDLQTNVLGNQVLLEEVALADSPIVVDETNSEYSELHVYKFTIHATDLINLDAILAKAGEFLDNKINGVAVDASNVVDTTVSETNTTVIDATVSTETNTTTETNTSNIG